MNEGKNLMGIDESSTPEPVLLAVDDDPSTLVRIELELRQRYGSYYRVACEDSPEAGLRKLQDLRAAGRKTEAVSGGEQNTTSLRMELIAACVALEGIDEGHKVTVYSDSSYLVNCMRRGWYKKWRENGWLTHRKAPVTNRDLWERILEATQRHQQVRWRKVKGHQKTQGPHKSGDDRADESAVAAKKEARRLSTPSPP
jgi:ribonuclease HI